MSTCFSISSASRYARGVIAGVFCVLLVASSHGQQAAVPSLAFVPAAPSVYQPFAVRVTFAEPVCFSVTSPVYSSVSFTKGVLRLVLSHLKPGPCVTERLLPVSGLPAGTHTVRVSVTSFRPAIATDLHAGGTTIENELASASLVVAQRAEIPVVNVYSAKVLGDGIYKPFAATEGGGGPVVLWLQHGETLTGGGEWLEVGSPRENGYAFKLMGTASATPPLMPPPFEPVYFFRYPAPFQGHFAVTGAECVQLLKTWFGQTGARACAPPMFYGLSLKNGACPLGASPVFRLFHPVSIAHRYTQSADTYSELQNFGFIGEGAPFCALARD